MNTYEKNKLRELRYNLRKFQEDHKLRDSWHEPDNQSIDATVTGSHLDNAMGIDLFDPKPHDYNEFVIHLHKVDWDTGEKGEILLNINLADLLALACFAEE